MINSYTVWLGFCAAFLIGLVDWRRVFSLRNLDLLMMLSFSVSLWFFNRGNVFAAMPLIYPGFAWLLARSLWIGRTGRAPLGSSVWPVWVLVGATVFLAGFRDDPQRRALERDRRGPLRRDRGRADRDGPGSLRQLPDRGQPAPVRPSPTRRGRSGTASRRTAAARPRTRRATPTARSPTRPTCRATSRSAGAASGTRCRRRTRPPSSGTRCASSASGSSAGASADPGWPRRLPSPGPRGPSRSTRRTRTRTT